MIASFEGNGNTVVLEEDCIQVERSGVMGSIAHSSEMKIPLSTIQTIMYRKDSIFANGLLQFCTLGGRTEASTIFFFPGRNSEALAFKEKVERQMEICKRKEADHNGKTVIQSLSGADEIKKYKELLDSGIISQEEFDAKKKQILGV